MDWDALLIAILIVVVGCVLCFGFKECKEHHVADAKEETIRKVEETKQHLKSADVRMERIKLVDKCIKIKPVLECEKLLNE